MTLLIRVPFTLLRRSQRWSMTAARPYSVMEKPHILALQPGDKSGIHSAFAPIIEKHFTIISNDEFTKDKQRWADKVQAVFVWCAVPKLNRDLLQALPNLKAVINGGVGVDHLDIPLISSFGVKVTSTPNLVNNATADLGMTLLLASARKVIQGLVVDQDALFEALSTGLIHAAALDVTYPEPLPRDHPLLKLDNVLILPHMGSHTYQTTQVMVERMVANALAILNGQPPLDEVKASK